ncbi:MAG: hypothetical protein ACJASX_001182 [Limisphaerales bacterium]|jgi:hypothetical protein
MELRLPESLELMGNRLFFEDHRIRSALVGPHKTAGNLLSLS